jgi:radical SAM/Cys-rich protein
MRSDGRKSGCGLAAVEEIGCLNGFALALQEHGIELVRGETATLQVNLGLLCNQVCKHCHLDAGPGRTEIMDLRTVRAVADYARRGGFHVIDVTGGAPELNPHILEVIELFTACAPRMMFRSNLTVIGSEKYRHVLDALVRHGAVIVTSLPALNSSQLDSQRGRGVHEQSIAALKLLNSVGYGVPESGLELNLVSNPTGAFLPASQAQAEAKFRVDLQRKWGIVFTSLFTFANMPLGRYRRWLEQSGNLLKYMEKLSSRFNPCTVEGLMCRGLVSVSWDGYLYDCDFNQAVNLPLGGARIHVSDMTGPPEPGTRIAVAEHCYACTAGSGFT